MWIYSFNLDAKDRLKGRSFATNSIYHKHISQYHITDHTHPTLQHGIEFGHNIITNCAFSIYMLCSVVTRVS